MDKRLHLMMACTFLLTSACSRESSSTSKTESSRSNPSPNLERSERKIANFDAIDISSALMVDITIGLDYSVVVEASPDLQEHIRTVRHGSTLALSFQGSNLNGDARIFVTLPQLQRLELSGASNVFAHGIQGEALTLEMSGASYARLEGKVDQLHVDASGASTVKAKQLIAQQAEVKASGASNLRLYAEKRIHGSLSGASNIRHSGPADDIQVRSSGASILSRD